MTPRCNWGTPLLIFACTSFQAYAIPLTNVCTWHVDIWLYVLSMCNNIQAAFSISIIMVFRVQACLSAKGAVTTRQWPLCCSNGTGRLVGLEPNPLSSFKDTPCRKGWLWCGGSPCVNLIALVAAVCRDGPKTLSACWWSCRSWRVLTMVP